VRCWAASLGDCAEGKSREHYVSDGIFDGETITAIGMTWCRNKPKEIPLKKAVAKILCRKHNSALSKFDQEAARLSKFLIANVYSQPAPDANITLNGRWLEKWALKTFFNLGYLRALHREQPNAIEPPESLIHYIYRNTSIPEGIGLYHVSNTIDQSKIEAGLFWNVMRSTEQPNSVVGLTMAFYGIRFVVITEPVRAESKIQQLGLVNGFDFSKAQVNYRPTSIAFLSSIAGTKNIELQW
jgi:hypothetical protein